jgi:hypothetical protein
VISLNGPWEEVLFGLYQVFEKDFKLGRPEFEDRLVLWDSRILPGDKYEEGFWHLISRDDRETGQRLPDFRRAERLPWCAPTLRNSRDPVVKVWDHGEASGRVRTYLWLEDLDYVVIVEKKEGRKRKLVFLVTAYYVDGDSARRSLTRKHNHRL